MKKKFVTQSLISPEFTKAIEKETAYHEAGHVVMALHKGIPFNYVTMGSRKPRKSPHIKEKFPLIFLFVKKVKIPHYPIVYTKLQQRHFAHYFLAGWVAEQLATKKAKQILQKKPECSRRHFTMGSDLRKYEWLFPTKKDADKNFMVLLNETYEILLSSPILRRQIRIIASVLLNEKKLSYQQVNKLLKSLNRKRIEKIEEVQKNKIRARRKVHKALNRNRKKEVSAA